MSVSNLSVFLQIKVKELSLASIVEDEESRQRRDYGTKDEMEALKESIKREGLINPISVVAVEGSNLYRLVAGGRRFRALKEMEVERAVFRVFPHTVDDIDLQSIELWENLARKDLRWDEKNDAIARLDKMLKDKYGEANRGGGERNEEKWSTVRTAQLIGAGATTVADAIKISEVISKVPSLRKAKSANEVQKLIKKVNTIADVSSRAQAVLKSREHDMTSVKNSLIHAFNVGDAIEGLKATPSESVSLVELDPPYGVDIEDNKKGSFDLTKKMLSTYHEIPQDEYIAWIEPILREAYRVCKPDGWLVLWFAHNRWYNELRDLILKVGFQMGSQPCAWIKNIGQTQQPQYYLGSAMEMFFYARKSSKSCINRQGSLNYFSFPTIPAQFKAHVTEKPIDLLEAVIRTFVKPNSRIISPFLGSGNTILAAYNAHCQCYGWDLQQEHKNAYILKVDAMPSTAEGASFKFESYRGASDASQRSDKTDTTNE